MAPAKPLISWMESSGAAAPWLFVALFVTASLLMLWRLEAMSDRGFEGTVLGTLVMPYCSGIGNLIFAFLLGKQGGPGKEVMINSLVNNVTNLTLVIGLPTLLWGLQLAPAPKRRRNGGGAGGTARELNRLSLLLTLTAALFFLGAVWALPRDGRLDFGDGLVLVGLFLFWQCFHVFEVLKGNVRQGRSLGWRLPLDLALLAVGAYGVYRSTAWLVGWVSNIRTGFVSVTHLGWLSGWLMVLPNALLAVYYGWRRRAEVVYASQVGDGHICIPLCVGIYALHHPLPVPALFQTGLVILLGATLSHILFVIAFDRLPRIIGWVLVVAYGWFLYRGLPR